MESALVGTNVTRRAGIGEGIIDGDIWRGINPLAQKTFRLVWRVGAAFLYLPFTWLNKRWFFAVSWHPSIHLIAGIYVALCIYAVAIKWKTCDAIGNAQRVRKPISCWSRKFIVQHSASRRDISLRSVARNAFSGQSACCRAGGLQECQIGTGEG